MATTNDFGRMLLFGIVLMALALLLLAGAFTPNDHALEKHGDAAWLFDNAPDEAKCYENGTKRLHLFPFMNDCGREKAGGIITTTEGDTITAFIADLKYWLKVIARDGYAPH